MENVGRKGEGNGKIENRETERESSHLHSVRGSKYQALCWHLSEANARALSQKDRTHRQKDRQTLLLYTSTPSGPPTPPPLVQSLPISIQVCSALCAPVMGGSRLEGGQ